MNIAAARGEITGTIIYATPEHHCVINMPFTKCVPMKDTIFLEVNVPNDAPSGTYDGNVLIGGTKYDIHLTVHPFNMPSNPVPVYMGLNSNRVANVEGGDRSMMIAYRMMLHEHRVDQSLGITIPTYDSNTGQCNFTDSYFTYLNKLPVKSIYFLSCPFRFDKWPQLQNYLHSYGVMLKTKYPKLPVAVYLVDEPNTPESKENANKLHEFLTSTINPIKSIIPGSFKTLSECRVDIPVYNWGHDYDPGKRHWIYTALRNRNGSPSWLADQPNISFIAPFWAGFSTGAEGFWYWTAVLDFDYSINGVPFPGEGQLITRGPTPTRQLKMIREGINCYDYLSMLKDRNLARRIASVVAPKITEFETDLSLVYEAKNLLAAYIISGK